METIKIEQNVPIPDRHKNGKIIKFKYPLHIMEVGDSFLIKATSEEEKYKVSRSLCTCVRQWRLRHKSKKQFITKREDKGIRTWRIK
jgi:hypothetical protein